ncbi:MAG TPA: alpha-glucuronidase family glycosyl hydrolase, partial [Candidatus Solibacter sp.]|nr:alpha-glucuronidase family glycosyl hydrolase [Candidatus Solibacter sp.]
MRKLAAALPYGRASLCGVHRTSCEHWTNRTHPTNRVHRTKRRDHKGALLALLLGTSLHAETGAQAWLRYAPLDKPPALPAVVVVQGDSPVLLAAREELIRGIRGMTGRTLRIESDTPKEPAIVIRTGNLPPDA